MIWLTIMKSNQLYFILLHSTSKSHLNCHFQPALAIFVGKMHEMVSERTVGGIEDVITRDQQDLNMFSLSQAG